MSLDPQYYVAVTGVLDFIEGEPKYLKVADIDRAQAMPAKIARTIRRYIAGEPDKSLHPERVDFSWPKLSKAVKARSTADATGDTDAMEKLIDGLPGHAELSAGYIGSLQRVTQYVTDTMPVSAAASLAGIRPKDPSMVDQARWKQKVTIAEEPLYVLQWLAEGRLTSAAVDALQATYPAILAQMVESAIEGLATASLNTTWSLPGDKSRQLSLILGADPNKGEIQSAIQATTQEAAKDQKSKPPSDATNNKVSKAFGPASPTN